MKTWEMLKDAEETGGVYEASCRSNGTIVVRRILYGTFTIIV